MLALLPLVGCGSGDDAPLDSRAMVVELPGAMRAIDFDDIVYSQSLDRILIPARQSGLYVVDPATGDASRLGRLESADSADEGDGTAFVIEREQQRLDLLDARTGRTRSSVSTSAPGDYVRYVTSTRELWVTEPAATPAGIEIFSLGTGEAAARRTGFIPVPSGPEGLQLSASNRVAYTHAGSDVVVIDVPRHTVTSRWSTGCRGTHGFPRVDARGGLLVASCAEDGEVVLLDARDGRRLDTFSVGGGEALPGYSSAADDFYVRGDPGTKLATLDASRTGFSRVEEVAVPQVGHCLTADAVGHYWTCDAERGRLLRFADR